MNISFFLFIEYIFKYSSTIIKYTISTNILDMSKHKKGKLSLEKLQDLSKKLLQYLIKMSRGCNVLRDVADILNANVQNYDPIDLEMGCQENTTCDN